MRIVIIEDLLMFREALREICRRLGHEVVAETGLGAEGRALTRRHQPDVLLLDLWLPDIDGFAVAEQILKSRSTTKVLVVSAHCEDYTVFRLEQLGVHGFIDKHANTAAMLGKALEAIGCGRRFYSSAFQAVSAARRCNPRDYTKTLTEWERTILGYIAIGYSDEEIASRVGIAARTVQGHRSNMIRKLNVTGTPKLMAFAHEHGIAPPQQSSIR
jgi:two-component system response regulator EvgA